MTKENSEAFERMNQNGEKMQEEPTAQPVRFSNGAGALEQDMLRGLV